jgi:competence protein ComEA
MASDQRRRSLIPYLVGAVVLVLLAMRAFAASGGGETPAVALDGAGAQPPQTGRPGGRIWVHVAGAVRRPGLYRVAPDSRAGVVVEAAGGLARRADARSINLAATVRDGQQIVVPARGERPAAPAGGEAPPAGQLGAPPGAPGSGLPGAGGAKVKLSTATVEQLDALDGIGPTLAQRILQWRDAHGGFRSVDQLRQVDGIGEKRFEALRAAVEP